MRAATLAVLISLFAACSNAPPLAELPLRDALSATPEAIAELPESARRSLADRLESARKVPQPREPAPTQATAADEVRTVDAARIARGADALVIALDKESSLHVHVDDGAPIDAPLPALEGAPATDTADDEARAIDGRAGAILVDLAKVSGARHVVRVTQWPIAAVAVGDTIYVNAAWLVALASLETSDAGAHRPLLHTTALRGNPYRTYDTLAACTNDVSTRCATCIASGVDCDETATLSDFGSGRAECDYLAADPQRVAQLCALALMSISSVSRCVNETAGCSIPSGTTNNTASLSATSVFLSNSRCISALNQCLSGSTSTAIAPDAGESSSAPRSTEGCQDPFSACASSMKGCSKACQAGSCSGEKGDSCGGSGCSSCDSKGDSCGSCSKSSDSTSSSSSSSSCGGSGSKGCTKCASARPVHPLEPLVPPAMLAMPLLYLLLRARRAR
jgi:hypothetical protein